MLLSIHYVHDSCANIMNWILSSPSLRNKERHTCTSTNCVFVTETYRFYVSFSPYFASPRSTRHDRRIIFSIKDQRNRHHVCMKYEKKYFNPARIAEIYEPTRKCPRPRTMNLAEFVGGTAESLQATPRRPYCQRKHPTRHRVAECSYL